MFKSLVCGFFYYSGLANIRKKFFLPAQGMILAYHRVSPITPSDYILRDMIVGPEAFERQMIYLKNHYRVVTLDNFLENLSSKNKPSNKDVVITFDDAYADNYEYALPILKKYNLPATIFVPTAFIEATRSFWWDSLAKLLTNTKKQFLAFSYKGKELKLKLRNNKLKRKAFFTLSYLFKHAEEEEQEKLLNLLSNVLAVSISDLDLPTLAWSQIREMSMNAISFGAHTNNHCVVSHLTDKQFEEELTKSKEILESQLGRKITVFAYPYGEKDDFSASSIAALARAGYKTALTMIQDQVFPHYDVYALPRLGVEDGKDISFKLKLDGFRLPLWK